MKRYNAKATGGGLLNEVDYARQFRIWGDHSRTGNGIDALPNYAFLILLLLVTSLLYFKTFSYPFLFDDTMQIVGNRHIMDAGYIHTYFTQDVWSHLAGKHPDGYYRPLLLLWFRTNYVLFGDAPFYWHLSTVFLHLICVVLTYTLALRFLRDHSSACLAAALYALHPVQVEGTAWVSGVNGSLCAMFVLSAFLCYMEFHESGHYLYLGASLLSFALALLAKESAISFAGLILVYEWFARTKRYRLITPYLAITLFYWIARNYALGAAFPDVHGRAVVPVLLSLPWLLFLYMRMLLVPNRLAVFYDFELLQRASDPRFWGPLLIAAAIFVYLARNRKAVFFTGWFLILLAPAFAYACVSMSGEVYNGRQLCLPLAAFSIALAAGANNLRRKQLLCACIVLLLPISWQETRYWSNSKALFEHTYQVSSTSYLAATTYIDQLIPERRYQEAIAVGSSALKQHPHEPVLLEAVARVEFLAGRYASAADHYQAVAESFSARPDVWFRLGFSYLYLGRDAEAANALRRAVQLDDQEPAYHYELGIALANLHRNADAIAQVREAEHLAGDSRLGRAYGRELKRLQYPDAGNSASDGEEVGLKAASATGAH